MKYSFLFLMLLFVSCEPRVKEDEVLINEAEEFSLWMDTVNFEKAALWRLDTSSIPSDLPIDRYPMMKPFSFTDPEMTFSRDFIRRQTRIRQ